MWHWSIWWLKYIALNLRIEHWTFFQKGGFHDMKLQAMHHVLLIVNSNLLSSEFLSLASYHGNIFLSFIAHFHQFFSIIKFSSSFIILFFNCIWFLPITRLFSCPCLYFIETTQKQLQSATTTSNQQTSTSYAS